MHLVHVFGDVDDSSPRGNAVREFQLVDDNPAFDDAGRRSRGGLLGRGSGGLVAMFDNQGCFHRQNDGFFQDFGRSSGLELVTITSVIISRA